MSYCSRAPYSRKQSIAISGTAPDTKFQTKAHLMEALKNIINVDTNLLHSDEMRNTLPNEMIQILQTDTSQSG